MTSGIEYIQNSNMLAETTLTFGSPIAFWILSIVVGIFSIGMLLLYYRDMKTRGRKRAQLFLWIFRILVITWVTIILLEPTIVSRTKHKEDSDVVILIDISDSLDLGDRPSDERLRFAMAHYSELMTEEQKKKLEEERLTADDFSAEQLTALFKKTRREYLEKFLAWKNNEFLNKLSGDFGVRIFTFASDIKPAEIDSGDDGISKILSGIGRDTKTTDLGSALNEVEKLASKGRLSGIILVSDGDWNSGPDPLMGARRLAVNNVPIFPIGLGNPDEIKDIEVEAVKARKSVQVNDTVAVQVDIRSRGYDNENATVVLKEEGTTLQEKTIDLKKELRTQSVRLEFKATTERMMHCTVHVLPKKDEARADNNTRNFEVEVTKGQKKVLVVEQVPRWEWRFIKNAVSRDPDFELTMVLFNLYDRPSEGEQYLPTIPMTRRELYTYDVVILGDVARDQLSEEQLKLLEEFVSIQGASLVIISGPFHMPHEYRGSEKMENLFPVVLGTSPNLDGGIAFDESFNLELTSEGWNSPILQLGNTPAENTRIWAEIPGFYWCASVERAKAGSVVLATHPHISNQYGKMPIIVTQRYGAGKVLMINTDEMWRWRYEKGDLYHYRFWGNVLRWLAASPLDGKTRHILLSIDKKEYYPGEKASISARVLDQNFFPYTKNKILLRVMKDPGRVEQIDLTLEDGKKGIYSTEYTFDESGSFEFQTILPELGDEGNAKVRVDVKKVSVEDNSLQMNRLLLEKIAAITGGSFHDLSTARGIPGEIINRSMTREDVRRTDLWDKYYALLIVVAFLTLEWVLRKRLGYV